MELPSIESDNFINSEITAGTNPDFNKTSIFVHVVKYRILCGKIVSTLHSPKKAEHSDTMMRQLRDCLTSELEDWHYKTQELKLTEQTISSLACQNRSSFL